jgi:hypothetical protein
VNFVLQLDANRQCDGRLSLSSQGDTQSGKCIQSLSELMRRRLKQVAAAGKLSLIIEIAPSWPRDALSARAVLSFRSAFFFKMSIVNK